MVNDSDKSMPLAVECRNLNFAYDHGSTVLKNVNLQIKALDSACIIGSNGGGKSTLVKLILGLLTPTSGEVKVLGRSPVKARCQIGYVPQYFALDSIFPISVLEVVLMGRLKRSWNCHYRKSDYEKAYRQLELLELGDLARRSFGELSGGQRQRVLIARALVSDPEILLLDEPISNADPETQHKFYSILSQLKKKMTILLVSHDQMLAASCFDYVICVNREVFRHSTARIKDAGFNGMFGADFKIIEHDRNCCCNEAELETENNEKN